MPPLSTARSHFLTEIGEIPDSLHALDNVAPLRIAVVIARCNVGVSLSLSHRNLGLSLEDLPSKADLTSDMRESWSGDGRLVLGVMLGIGLG